ncbi:MAG: 2-dehydro-3-deoxyphosphogluconate aldolase [Microbacterium sp.]|jgi:2-dehydro-3-deoxyphosphogluconate aldolase/(4S)-4-hydroxy-2-oxoglutarate aldolase|uniref:bifunctional 4-hydroxy-2-oxoglutarate aldolase/2-dehydro-3-deoxy-phosphogluconate aldolase n=1 Tax=Microbacterium sp. TaxID=51671 RepID=UPI0026382E4E|nr:bifunctional 4-hydroxy-2-oxoglutarate aldolase/2-dehydro-3-deoxy-phosphogluconate aldolase [Microbacterium sp.]MDF2561882.1 2-dehydro-3-deoxyphosphogluconate aldolase [Microbacterium sp.]
MSDFFEEMTSRAPVVVILRGESPDRTVELCHLAWDLGVRLVEVPIASASAVPALQAATAAATARGELVGAGSIHSVDQFRAAVDAGAAFTVAAATDREIIALAASAGIPHLPGVGTATDVATALAGGCNFLKAFPASLLTPDWIRAMRGPFPSAKFVATGGVDAGNALAFLEAGCSAVAFGSSFAAPATAAVISALVGHPR